MELSGWGRFPKMHSDQLMIKNQQELKQQLIKNLPKKQPLIARGLGRSYGDSALAPTVLNLEQLDTFLDFDQNSGVVTCHAGVSLAELLNVFVPQGWFLPVTPGTKFVTVGGAVASDVHGKNHHVHGCFSEFVQSLSLLLANGEILECSKEQHPELFQATCGGMGLTGVIVTVTLKLLAISSTQLQTTTFKAPNLESALQLFERESQATYSVAWIDCLATGDSLGRSLVMLGEHQTTAQPALSATTRKRRMSVPFNVPGVLLNRYSIQAFNTLYYQRIRSASQKQISHYEPFFYPLDGLLNWNRLYGKRGFTQYQFALPKAAGLQGMSEIIECIAQSKKGSFLAVLKALGPANNNLLSFPIEGYTLALDFKIEKGLFKLLNTLDKIVLQYGGRLYLSKDARMSESTFKQSYPNWERFQAIRQQYQANEVFQSLQAIRLGL